MNLQEARKIIVSAPSFAELKKAAIRFHKRIHGQGYTGETDEDRPERYLTMHSHVMNSKSQACKTMKRLADQIFRETGLPRKPVGQFRGMDGLNTELMEQ